MKITEVIPVSFTIDQTQHNIVTPVLNTHLSLHVEKGFKIADVLDWKDACPTNDITVKINLLFRCELLRTSRYFYHISCYGCCMNNK